MIELYLLLLHFTIEHDTTCTSLGNQEETLSNGTANHAPTLMNNIHIRKTLVDSRISELYEELCSSFTKSSSNVNAVTKPLPLPRQLTAITKDLHDITVKPLHFKSASFPDTTAKGTEGAYNNIYDVALPNHDITPKG